MIEIAADLWFGTGAAGQAALDDGWAEPEPKFVWSLGAQSRVSMPVTPGAGTLFLELDVEPFILPPGLRRQSFAVGLHDILLGEWELDGRAVLGVPIPVGLARGKSPLVFTLYHPDAARPADYDLNTDTRRLGIKLRHALLLRLPVEKTPKHRPGWHQLEHEYRFAAGGSGLPWLRDGWTGPEGDGSWTLGRRSTLHLPLAHPGDAYTLLLEANARTSLPELPIQRFVIGANARMVATFALGRHTTLALPLPATATTEPEIVLTFDNIDAEQATMVSPADPRPLGLSLFNLRVVHLAPSTASAPGGPADLQAPLPAGLDNAALAAEIRQRTGLALPDLLLRFEALRHGCELAQAQNAFGHDPVSLLRFVTIGNAALVRGIALRFHHLGRPDWIVEHTVEGAPFIGIRELGHEMLFKTPYPVGGDLAPERLVRLMARRLSFLRRQFLDELDHGDKIYVLRSLQQTMRPEAEAVSVALRLHGRHTLLWLTQDGSMAPGSVVRLGPDLLQGELDVTGQFGTASQSAWISVLANAWVLAKG